MSKEKDAESSLTEDELREAFEVLKEYALPLTREQARALFDKLGGLKKVTLALYVRLMQEGQFDLAAKLMADVEARSHNPDPEIAREYSDILANMKHDT
jgi:hypothetical protein